MNKYLMVLCLILYCSLVCNKISGKTTENTKLTLPMNEKKALVALGQLWGFLKYHHPLVASGSYDWDRELIKRIPEMRQTEDESVWKKKLNDWLDSLPPIEEKERKFSELRVKVKPDYGELFNEDYFNSETIEKIKYILKNGEPSSTHYVKVDNSYLTFMNESDYEDMLYPDSSYRLLALFRYWNIVNYFFPYRNLCDQRWSDVLSEMLPVFIDAKNQEEYINACRLLAAKIDDSHAYVGNDLIASIVGIHKVPFETRFIEDKLIITSYTADVENIKKKIQIGDIITKIDEEAVEDIVKRMLPYTSASNYAVKQREIALRILRTSKDTVSLTLSRDGNTFEIEVPCYGSSQLKLPNYSAPFPKEAEAYSIIDNNIGLVLPSNCTTENRDKGIKKVLAGTKGVIVDFRCYPDDYISFPFLKHLNPASNIFSLVTHADASYPGYFFIAKWYDNVETPKVNPNPYPNKIVVIVNEYTQSAAEDIVLGFQTAPNTIVIGTTTAGADGSIVRFSLPGKVGMVMSGRGVYYPDGSNLQRAGVKIDEIVKPTIKGIREGRDEMFERALAIINESTN
ncbi:MAG: S41 family peptidase [Dysgonomonas sp.]